jgi:hypothetical protein
MKTQELFFIMITTEISAEPVVGSLKLLTITYYTSIHIFYFRSNHPGSQTITILIISSPKSIRIGSQIIIHFKENKN